MPYINALNNAVLQHNRIPSFDDISTIESLHLQRPADVPH